MERAVPGRGSEGKQTDPSGTGTGVEDTIPPKRPSIPRRRRNRLSPFYRYDWGENGSITEYIASNSEANRPLLVRKLLLP